MYRINYTAPYKRTEYALTKEEARTAAKAHKAKHGGNYRITEQPGRLEYTGRTESRYIGRTLRDCIPIEEVERIHPARALCYVQTYNGGRYGRGGEYIQMVNLEYYNNGRIKRGATGHHELITIRKEYGYPGCRHSERIAAVLEIYRK